MNEHSRPDAELIAFLLAVFAVLVILTLLAYLIGEPSNAFSGPGVPPPLK